VSPKASISSPSWFALPPFSYNHADKYQSILPHTAGLINQASTLKRYQVTTRYAKGISFGVMAKDLPFASVAIIWERIAASSIGSDKKGIGIHGTRQSGT
jgi:hypothetical protein